MKTRCICKTFLAGMLVFAFLAFLDSNHVSATASTLTLTIDSATVRADVAPTSSQGTFSKTTGSTITASTDNATGYTLSISAPTSAGSDYDKLINTTDNTAKLNSISSPTTEEQYKALNATSYNNTWGYLPSKYCSDGTSTSCATNTSFLPAPTTTGDILDQTTSANSTANTYTIGMGTRIDSNAKTGKYTNSFVVKLVANAIPYTIIYDDNVVSNMPTDISSTTPDSTVNIASSTPTREGYIFLGWCTVVPTNNNGTDECTGGTTYQPSATLTIDQTGTGNNFHFYAMWKEPCAGQVKMQELTSSSIATLLPNEHSTATVCDTRDEETYTIAKLKDGKYWMVENLNLAGGTALSSTDTDFESTYTLPTTNGWTTNNGKLVLPASDSTGFGIDNYAYVYNTGNETSTCTTPGCYSYYSWDAATLGSGRSISTDNTDAPYSICPKGWKLPSTYNGSGTAAEATDFRALMIALGGSNSVQNYDSSTTPTGATISSALQADPYNFLLGGTYYGSSFFNGGSNGYYWSATSYSSSTSARYLYFYSSGVKSASNDYRRGGFSVRCLLR